ncbi:hypothetical protein [Rubellicoccus peritrichatus]|uniref:Uncharacterized protein n=1 Tax=Rubellicoccus peritrichatus TaxID=3080537 RepID=A0AAQ3QW32_9BACT|nr:hypothetical protein [Puniceicoccus sp. CR14]WOO41505.1 hypothetical protein RZN69_00290 [Puniceicoccus sp. CR14]
MRHILTGLLCLLVGAPIASAEPIWWTERNVLAPTTTNDFAAVNVGQAKFMAAMMIAEMNEKLGPWGGAQISMNDFINPNAATNDYAALTVGQLKFLATPFYDRLAEFDWFGTPTPSHYYSWTEVTTDDNDFAAVNAGQLKYMFDFDFLAPENIIDDDNDDLPDFWEIAQTGNLTTLTSPDTDDDNDGHTNIEEFHIRSNPTQAANTANSAQMSLTVLTPLED